MHQTSCSSSANPLSGNASLDISAARGRDRPQLDVIEFAEIDPQDDESVRILLLRTPLIVREAVRKLAPHRGSMRRREKCRSIVILKPSSKPQLVCPVAAAPP